jgi:hypothetical protein
MISPCSRITSTKKQTTRRGRPIALEASHETDPHRLIKLVTELNEALESDRMPPACQPSCQQKLA